MEGIMKSVLFFIFICLSAAPASGKIWHVDSNPGNSADFTTVQAAHDAASAGDTLYIMGSGVPYGPLVMTKRLNLFGPGFFLAENPETQANISEARIGLTDLNPGSEGSLITGLYFYYSTLLSARSQIIINASNIVFKRNRVYGNTNGTSLIFVTSGTGNVFIIQNYIQNDYTQSYCYGILLSGENTNIEIRNNFIIVADNSYAFTFSCPASSSATFSNNFTHGYWSLNYCVVTNNVMAGGFFTGGNNLITNNLCQSNQLPASSNKQNTAMNSSLFVSTGGTDAYYQLKDGSAGDNYGTDGTDVGPFGGWDPYVISGIPSLPTIYYLEAPASGSATNGLPVRIKAKSNR